MYAQSKSATAPRSRKYGNRPTPTRLRFGLIMRKSMDFGELGDMETALRFEGVSLAPISTGEGSLVSGGLTVLATATADDISGGRVQGVVVPGGVSDEAGLVQVKALLNLAKAQGLPVLAFADGVAVASEIFGEAADAPGAAFRDGKVALLNDRAALTAVVAAI